MQSEPDKPEAAPAATAPGTTAKVDPAPSPSAPAAGAPAPAPDKKGASSKDEKKKGIEPPKPMPRKGANDDPEKDNEKGGMWEDMVELQKGNAQMAKNLNNWAYKKAGDAIKGAAADLGNKALNAMGAGMDAIARKLGKGSTPEADNAAEKTPEAKKSDPTTQFKANDDSENTAQNAAQKAPNPADAMGGDEPGVGPEQEADKDADAEKGAGLPRPDSIENKM